MKTRIRPVRPEDLPAVAARMRPQDALEVWRHNRHTPLEALEKSAEVSVYVRTFEAGGKPAAVFGLVPDSLLGNTACIWLLGTDDINRCKLAYFKTCRKAVAGLLEMYPLLYNYVDAQYTAAHKWLKALGAEFLADAAYGAEGEIFKFFVIRRK